MAAVKRAAGDADARVDRNWPDIALDAWLLAGEAWMVVGLRCARLAGGGPEAGREARLMVTEKIDSAAALTGALLTGKLGYTPRAVIGSTIAHYRKGVSANRRRLMRR